MNAGVVTFADADARLTLTLDALRVLSDGLRPANTPSADAAVFTNADALG